MSRSAAWIDWKSRESSQVWPLSAALEIRPRRLVAPIRPAAVPDQAGYQQGRVKFVNAGVLGDYMSSGALLGSVNSEEYTVSFWFRRGALAQAQRYVLGAGPHGLAGLYALFQADGRLTIGIRMTDGYTYLLSSISAFTAVGEWHHVHLVGSAVSDLHEMRIDGLLEVQVGWEGFWGPSLWNVSAATSWRIGNRANSVSQNFTGALADLWIDRAYRPVTDFAEGGLPRYLGALPRPLVLLSGVQQWQAGINQGTGGNFTVVGALDETA